MKIMNFASIVLLVALGPQPASSEQRQERLQPAEAAVRMLIQRTEEANNAGDVQAWVDLFADDAVYMPPGAPSVTAREGLIQVAQAAFSHRASIDIEPVEIQILGNWAFARTRVSGSVTHDAALPLHHTM